MTQYIALGNACFGRHKEIGKAVSLMKRNYPPPFRKDKPDTDYDLLIVDDDAQVDINGNILSAHPVLWVRSVRWIGGQRRSKDMGLRTYGELPVTA